MDDEVDLGLDDFRVPELALVVYRASPYSTPDFTIDQNTFKDVSTTIDPQAASRSRLWASDHQVDLIEFFSRKLWEPLTLPQDDTKLLRRFTRKADSSERKANCTCASSGFRAPCSRGKAYSVLSSEFENKRAAFEAKDPETYRSNLKLGDGHDCMTTRLPLIRKCFDFLEMNHTKALSEHQ